MRRWCAVQSKPRQERVALANLLRQEYAAYLPQCAERKLTRGRYRSLTAPLFPGYVFVELDLGQDNIAPIRSTIGCCGLVRFGTRIPALPVGFIERLRELEQREGAVRIAEPEWAPGQRLCVTEGPFTGLNAIFRTRSAGDRASGMARGGTPGRASGTGSGRRSRIDGGRWKTLPAPARCMRPPAGVMVRR